jgi:hypothetical protein
MGSEENVFLLKLSVNKINKIYLILSIMNTPKESDIQKIEAFNSFICKSYGKDIVDYVNDYYSTNVDEKNLTVEEYAEMLNNDVIFKMLTTTINQHTLNKIHFWIVFWSVLAILVVFVSIYNVLR